MSHRWSVNQPCSSPLLQVEGAWRWPLAGAAVVAGPALAPLWAPAETLWLEGTRLVGKKGRRTTVVDLARLASVRRDWVPDKGDTLTLRDIGGNVITIWLLSQPTEALRGAIGAAARMPQASTDLFDPKTRRLLMMDREG